MPKSARQLPPPMPLWRSLGPSFILLGLALGSGELILWPYLAANWGMGLIWGALLGVSFQFVLNTEAMRYTLYWGESVFVGFRRLSILLPLWFVISTFIPWSLPGFSSAAADIVLFFLGNSMSYLDPNVIRLVTTIVLLLLTGLLLSSGKSVYNTMERFQKTIILLGLPFMFMLAFLLTELNDWSSLGWGIVGRGDGWWFFPSGVGVAAFLGAFAYSGAGGNLNLAQSYYIKEKGFGMGRYMEKISSLFGGASKPIQIEGATFVDNPANFKRWQGWWRMVNQEHFLVFWTLGVLTIALLALLAYAMVYGQELTEGINFVFAESIAISQLSTPLFGNFFLLLAAVMLFSTQVGVLESSSRIISENSILLFHNKGRAVNLSRAFYIALWGQIGLGILVYMIGFQEPRMLLTVSAILNAAAMMVSFALVWILNRLRLKKKYWPAKWRTVVMMAAFLFFLYFLVQIILPLITFG